MRVMLFCQAGDARPKCVKSFGWIASDGGPSPRALQYLGAIRFGTHLQPDRGWLVECESAALGRMAIQTKTEQFGRILASGGRP